MQVRRVLDEEIPAYRRGSRWEAPARPADREVCISHIEPCLIQSG